MVKMITEACIHDVYRMHFHSFNNKS